MIVHRKGDLLEQKDLNAIAHQCNCHHKMGAGIARQIKKMYPAAYEADLKTDYGSLSKMGTFSVAIVPFRGNLAERSHFMYVFNLYGQHGFGGMETRTDYQALRKALEGMNRYIDVPGSFPDGVRIGVPYSMGCGLAGGDWNIVYDILRDIYEKSTRFELAIVKLGN